MSSPDPDLPAAEQVEATVDLFSAVAHPVRLLVLWVLDRHGPHSVGELQELAGIEQSAMSHQLRVLREARLVLAERRGKQVFYEIHDHHVAHIVGDALAHVGEVSEDQTVG